MAALPPKSVVEIPAPENSPEGLVRECYIRSLQLLRANSDASGVIACARSEKASGRHYASIFGRDAAICSLGMVATGDPGLAANARESLLTLARRQAPNGQIPKYVASDLKEVDFWYSGCIDATLWWLIAVGFFDRRLPMEELGKSLQVEIGLALNWLRCQEHQGLFLIQQNEASDWADIMPRSGFVLYSNALWYKVKKMYRLPDAAKTKYFFNRLLYPFGNEVPEQRRARVLVHYIRNRMKPSPFYLSFVNFSFWGPEIDVFANVLCALLGPADSPAAEQITDALLSLKANIPFPLRVVHTPIRRNSKLWRLYMQRHLQNLPYQYHNGGIWPFTGGFWVMLLSKLGRKGLAWKELGRLAKANNLNNWEFNEWLHGKTGKPMGMAGQSWNAAMFLLAYHSLTEDKRFF